jgi:hypothetical protein
MSLPLERKQLLNTLLRIKVKWERQMGQDIFVVFE